MPLLLEERGHREKQVRPQLDPRMGNSSEDEVRNSKGTWESIFLPIRDSS